MGERKILILYGSQTGTAEEVAESLARDAFRKHFSIELCALDKFDIQKLLYSSLAIFVCSTTGQGDPPDNMKKFWKFIMRKNLPRNSLASLDYAVVGLGDSSYQKYNFVAKKLYRRLLQLSGTALLPPILCDDQHDLGPDAALDDNLPDMWSYILSAYPLPVHRSEISTSELLPPKYTVSVGSHGPHHIPLESSSLTQVNSSSPHNAKLLSNQRLTHPDHFQDVRLIRLDISKSNVKYEPGDVAYLRPQNSKATVGSFLSLLKLEGEQTIRVEPYAAGTHLPDRLAVIASWRELATNYLDLSTVPRRYFFELLSHFSRDDLEKEKLLEFCSAEGQDERFKYCNRVKRSIVEVLDEFRHTTPYIPANYILDLIPALQPRAFSIASAPTIDKDVIELLVAVVNYKTKLSEPRLGVCSNWLARMDTRKEDNFVPMWTEKGTFRFPTAGEPCILIGPGTGLAPFRSFIHHRITNGHHRNLLIFGSRNKNGDFLCGEEWEPLTSSGQLTLLTAFSRDQEDKYYVWNVMRDNSDLIWRWLHEDGAYVFIAGNAKRMPDDVRATLANIACDKLSFSTEEGDAFIADLEKTGRYQLECW